MFYIYFGYIDLFYIASLVTYSAANTGGRSGVRGFIRVGVLLLLSARLGADRIGSVASVFVESGFNVVTHNTSQKKRGVRASWTRRVVALAP